MKQSADRAFGQRDPIALLDHPREIDPSPTHHAMLGQIRPLPDQVGHLTFLFGGEPRLRSGGRSIVKALKPFGVVAVDPVAQHLPIHPARSRCLAAQMAVQNQRQGQHPSRRIGILRVLRMAAQLRRRAVPPRDRHRYWHARLPCESRRPGNHANALFGIPRESVLDAVGIIMKL